MVAVHGLSGDSPVSFSISLTSSEALSRSSVRSSMFVTRWVVGGPKKLNFQGDIQIRSYTEIELSEITSFWIRSNISFRRSFSCSSWTQFDIGTRGNCSKIRPDMDLGFSHSNMAWSNIWTIEGFIGSRSRVGFDEGFSCSSRARLSTGLRASGSCWSSAWRDT